MTVAEAPLAVTSLDGLTPEQQKNLLLVARAEVMRRCAADGWFWTQYVRTRDEADADAPVKPFPRDRYLEALWWVFTNGQRIAIAKSRQMMVSWVACAFCVWWALTKPHQHVVWQTQVEQDAIKMVCTASGDKDVGYAGRMQFILRNLPPWMRPAGVRETEGKLEFPNGSLIEAVAGGANKIRGKVPSLAVEDEFAFQDEAKGVYTAIAPLVQKQTKLIVISTPNGAEGSCFFHLWSGTPFA